MNNPGQAITYKIGEKTMLYIRDNLLKQGYSIKDIHEIILDRLINDTLVLAGTSAGAMSMSKEMIMGSTKVADGDQKTEVINTDEINTKEFKNKKEAENVLKELEKQMRKAAKELDFIEAANIRDKIKKIKDEYLNKK